jgi:hypothetical protein
MIQFLMFPLQMVFKLKFGDINYNDNFSNDIHHTIDQFSLIFLICHIFIKMNMGYYEKGNLIKIR